MEIFRDIALSARREPKLITMARRFCRRAREHGVNIIEPVVFRAYYVIIQPPGRAIRIDADGACLQLSSHDDPGASANYARLHAHRLDLAGRFRRRHRRITARLVLLECARDRQNCPKLPG